MTCSCSQRVEFYRRTRKRRWPAEVQAAMDRFKRRFGDILDDIRDGLADRLTQPGLPAGERVEQIVDLVISEHEEAIRTTLREGGRNGTTAGRRMASRRFGLDIDFEQPPESAINAVESAIRGFESDVLDEMGERFVSDIETWLEQGLGVDEIADKIQTQAYADRLDDRHTQTHARTVVQAASERGNLSAMQDAPGVVGKQWNTTLDGRARRTHRDADGQIAPIDGQFDVGGSTLRHPGDPAAQLEEIVNCRCYATPAFESDLSDDEVAQLRAGNILDT